MRMRLIARHPEAPGVESFIFKPAEELSWRAGQFLHWVLHHEPTDDRGSDRWFTISASPREGHVMLTTRFTEATGSSFKKALQELEEGSEAMEISDVDGDFVIEDPTRSYVFLAGGIGITPFRSILTDLDRAGTPIRATLLFANRDDAFPFKGELDALAATHAELSVHYLGAPARIDEETIRARVHDLSAPLFYVSGPEPMVEGLITVLQGMGVDKERIKGDWFPGYEGI